MTVLAGRASRQTIVGTVCVREWREAIGNKLLVGMTLFPPLIILVSGIFAVAAASLYPPSERDLRAIYAAAPAVAGLDPKEAVQGLIAQYFLILFMLIPTVVPLTIAIYSVIGEKAARTLEPLLATPVGVGELLLAKSIASTVPAVLVTWFAYGIYLFSVTVVGSQAARGRARHLPGHRTRGARQRVLLQHGDHARGARPARLLRGAPRVPAGEHPQPLAVSYLRKA